MTSIRVRLLQWLVGPILLVIPMVGVVVSTIALRQIKNSNGTETGRLLGILGLVITAAVRGVHPNMTLAYREIAFPAAVLAGAAALVTAIVLEVRYRRV